ncbi:MAG TPA: Ig-like domain repeat protein [Candidatus Microsaccharimonas sp.]|jgi:hypothetical protein
MKYFFSNIQRTATISIMALLIMSVMMVGASFVLTQKAHAITTPITDVSSPTAPGIPTTLSPTHNSTSQWTWAPATDLPTDPTIASGVKGYQYQFTQDLTVITPWTDTTATSATTVAPVDGTYQLHVRAYDNAGNSVGPESVGVVILDQVPPVVSITSPANGATVDATKKMTITGTTGDAVSYTLSIGKTGQTPVDSTSGASFTSYIWDATGVPSNSYIVTLTGTDAAGNSSVSELLVFVASAPTVTVNSSLAFTRYPKVTGTVSADAASITVVFLDRNGKVIETGTATYTPGQTTWSYTARTPLTGGLYTIQARAFNAQGIYTDAQGKVLVFVPCIPHFGWWGWGSDDE